MADDTNRDRSPKDPVLQAKHFRLLSWAMLMAAILIGGFAIAFWFMLPEIQPYGSAIIGLAALVDLGIFFHLRKKLKALVGKPPIDWG